MKTTLITTVLNEEASIASFLESVRRQTKMPEEIIIVDGGSTDSTVDKVKSLKFKIINRKGNRSVGRNEAIKRSAGNIIAITDAGCVLDKDWLKNITAPFASSKVDVVAGYYKAKADSVFKKSLTPYVLIMPDKIDSDNFFPATRSMAIKKSIWKKAGKFDEKFSHNEDYVFAKI